MKLDPVRCVSHMAGHQPHWIQSKQSQKSPGRPARAAAVGGGWVEVDLDDGEHQRLWCHYDDRLDGLLSTDDGRVQLRSHGVLTGSDGYGPVVSVAQQPSPCVTPNEVPEDAGPVEVLERLGGFTLPGNRNDTAQS